MKQFMHPRARTVSAYVGAFLSDFLGHYPGPAAAVRAARDAGYPRVAIMYMNGNAETVETAE